MKTDITHVYENVEITPEEALEVLESMYKDYTDCDCLDSCMFMNPLDFLLNNKPKEIRTTMEESLHMLMGEDYSNCSGTTKKDGYLAFYQSKGLYSVEHEDSGIVSLVYAKNPFEAIDLIDEFRRMVDEQK